MESYHLFFIAGASLLLATPVLLISFARVEPSGPSAQQRLQEILSGERNSSYEPESDHPAGKSSRLRGDAWRQVRSESEHLAIIAHKLRLAGVISSRAQMKLVMAGIAFSLSAAAAASSWMVLNDMPPLKTTLWTLAVLAFASMFLYSLLDRRATRRQQQIEDESLMLIQTTRMLWRVGLSLPKTLSILCGELLSLTPECARELRIATQKIEAGQSQDEALFDLASNTTSDGLKEYLIMLRQESLSGGGIDKGLQELYEALQNRRKTRSQEKVSKMSAHMSIVSMLLLIPALLIVIGGPGFLAISKAVAQAVGG